MKPRFFSILALSTFVMLAFLSVQSATAKTSTEWYGISQDIKMKLLTEEKNRLEWKAELQAKMNKNAMD
ncbi:MAG: hypothetical protein Q4C70_08745 [Planctomycetia bacterium]|nr:hypothetical protein [Planctomycetia bacterium]